MEAWVERHVKRKIDEAEAGWFRTRPASEVQMITAHWICSWKLKGEKAWRAMMAMKAMKKVSTRTAKSHVWHGWRDKTVGGLDKSALHRNKAHRIVSKKRSKHSKRNPWILAVRHARAELGIEGFVLVKKMAHSRRPRFTTERNLSMRS